MLPFGHRLGTLGVQMLPLGRFGGSLKFNVFLEGSRCSLWLENDSKRWCEYINFWSPFWDPFPKGTPLREKYHKSNIFRKKYYSFLMCFALYAVFPRRYTHEKHIKKTLSSDSAGSDWLSLADTRQVKFKEQITSSKYTEVICSVNLTCQVSPSYSFHWFFLFCSMS